MTLQSFSLEPALAPLSGMVVDAYAQEAGYWHPLLALRVAGGEALVWSTQPQSAGARLEVFPIQVTLQDQGRFTWQVLPSALVIARATPLWRCEWLEAGACGPTLGDTPATHFAGAGPAPPHALAVARVLAGVLLDTTGPERLVIHASDTAPFNVELSRSAVEVASTLTRFETPDRLRQGPARDGAAAP